MKWATTMKVGVAGLVGGSTLAFGLAVSAAEVTQQRLENSASEAQNWLMVYQRYSSYMHSNLRQINLGNVEQLTFKFAVALGGMTKGGRNGNQEAFPLVDGGFLYANTAWNEVHKIDVRSGSRGQILWTFDPDVDPEAPVIVTSRGIALSGNNVYLNTLDHRLIAADTESAEVVFDINTYSDLGIPLYETHTAAPLAVKDMIMVSTTALGRGGRGRIAAYSAETGEEIWRFYTIPGPGEPGHETWADDLGNSWATGSSGVWTTGTYDQELGIILYGVGEPGPWWEPEYRPGDNLYSVSTVALNVDTGALEWYFQEIPNDSWDMDSVNPRLLYNVEIDGVDRRVSGHFARNGFFYTLDLADGTFIRANQYLDKVTWTEGIDPKSGLPMEYNPNTLVQDYNGLATLRDRPSSTCPYFTGATTYYPSTFDPGRMTAYSVGSILCGGFTITEPMDPAKDWRGERLCCRSNQVLGPPRGHITAVNVVTGDVVAKHVAPNPVRSGLVSTEGDLLFTGHIDGTLAAYDLDGLGRVWSASLGTPIHAAPITYSVDGKQYIAVIAGGSNQRNPRTIASSMLFVFGL